MRSRGRSWDDRLKCHEAGKRHEKLILSSGKREEKCVNVTQKFTTQFMFPQSTENQPSHDAVRLPLDTLLIINQDSAFGWREIGFDPRLRPIFLTCHYVLLGKNEQNINNMELKFVG